jgi:O-antigen/teichoic acid export membrane protein
MLRAIERPDQVFWAYVVSAVVTATVGIAALAYWGLLGAAVGQLAASLATAISLLLIVWLRSRPARAEASTASPTGSPAP